MSRVIQLRAPALPSDIDLVVGIPRSGLLPANMISLLRNVPLADLDGFIAGRILSAGRTRRQAAFDLSASGFRNVLVVDDSVFSGGSMREARQKLSDSGITANFIYCAIYSGAATHPDADIVLEVVPTPRMFQWNVFHHSLLARACIDLDDLILPPLDGARKAGMKLDCSKVSPICVPTRPVGHLVTGHPELRRAEVEACLQSLDVAYDHLWMPSRGGDPVGFKARVYKNSNAIIMMTCSDEDAALIAEDAQRPVLSLESHLVVKPAGARRFLEEARSRNDFLLARAKGERRYRFVRRLRNIARRLPLPV
jgi:hypothetical protein